MRRSTRRRGLLLTRSTYPSTGQYGGHVLGYNLPTWRHMRQSIIGAVQDISQQYVLDFIYLSLTKRKCGYLPLEQSNENTKQCKCEKVLKTNSILNYNRDQTYSGKTTILSHMVDAIFRGRVDKNGLHIFENLLDS